METFDPMTLLQGAVIALFILVLLLIGAMVYAYYQVQNFVQHARHAKSCADASYSVAEKAKVSFRTFKDEVYRYMRQNTNNLAGLSYAITELASHAAEVNNLLHPDEPDEMETPDEMSDPYQVQVINKQGDVLHVYDIEDLMQLSASTVEPDEHEQVELSQKDGSTSTVALAAGVLNGNKD